MTIKYSPSGYFKYDLKRNIFSDFKTEILGQSFFEVDDNNYPYWITAVLEPTIGLRGGNVQKAIILTDAITGENTLYKMEDIPAWIDHAYSVNYLMSRIEWHYYLANGYWNFSNTNRFKLTYSYRDSSQSSSHEENNSTPFDGYNSIISKDGEILFYTGVTPVNSAETNIGFITVSPKTGKVKFYSCDGAEESSAQSSAEGLVQNLKYSASFPTITNVAGEETYFMVLKDNAGLAKRYALCNVKNYTTCVEAESIDEAINKYLIAIGIKEKIAEKKDETHQEELTIRGMVDSVKEAEIAGYTYYYFTLDKSDKIYMSSIQNSNLQPIKLVNGAEVEIEYYLSDEMIATVSKIIFLISY